MTKPMRFNPASSLFAVITIVMTSGLISPVNDQIEVSEITSEIQSAERSGDPIAPYRENPWYWEYRGEPVLLIGASDQDNLFQWTDKQLTDHLDLLTSVGGNYLRNTMSDRDEGNLYAFQRLDNGQYDLDQWNEEYWERLGFFLKETHNRMNNVKVYGSMDGPNYSAGTAKEAAERFWRNIFAGSASSRFHRPAITWGIGLNERAQTNLSAMKMLLDELDIFTTTPLNDLLKTYVELSGSMEAYCLANIGHQYAVYFPAGRYSIDLDPWVYVDRVRIKWLDIDEGNWSAEEIIDVHWEGSIEEWGDRGRIRLTTPSNRSYVALLEVIE